jgi:hypothetical protein
MASRTHSPPMTETSTMVKMRQIFSALSCSGATDVDEFEVGVG